MCLKLILINYLDLKYPPNTALMEVQIPIINSTECKRLYEKEHTSNVIDNRAICAGYPKGGKDSCRVLVQICF